MTLRTRTRPYWTCRRCGFRNDRRWVKCRGDGKDGKQCTARRPPKREPKHAHPLRNGASEFQALNVSVHGGHPDQCAICDKPLDRPGSGQRDHAHFDGGYARGFLCWYCNKTLGLIERGKDGEEWMRRALDYVRHARQHHEREKWSPIERAVNAHYAKERGVK